MNQVLGNADPPRTPWRGFTLLAVLGTALRLALIWSGWVDRLVLADDAFYGWGSNAAGQIGMGALEQQRPLQLLAVSTLERGRHA